MPTATVIPCKRPRVTVEPIADSGLHQCHVPGCGWEYRSVKSDHLGAPHHRRAHRAAVPTVSLIRTNGAEPYHVECTDCGFLRCDGTTTTRADAETVRDHHMSHDHGLVVCS